MGPSIRFTSIVLSCCLFLSGCNIKVSVLGEGHVSAINTDVPTCTSEPSDLCLNAGYNQAVQLQAIPANGYTFAGWTGDCSGTEHCTVHSLGNRHAVAVFRKKVQLGDALIPAMRYLDDFFFSGPWPSDVRKDSDGTLNFADYPVGNGLLAKSARAEARRQSGFARNGSLYIPLLNQLQDPLDTNTPDAAYPASADSYLQLVNLSPDSPRYLMRIPLQTQLYTSGNLESTGLLQVIPETGYVLDPATTYGLVMFVREPTNDDGTPPVIKSRHMQTIIDQGAKGPLGEHWNRIKTFVSQHTHFTPNDVAAFSLFTTQPENPDYAAVKQFVASQDLSMLETTYRTDATTAYDCNRSNPFSQHTRLREYQMYLPYVLTGRPPYLLSGGLLNKDTNGAIMASEYPIRTRMIMTLPCTTPAPDSHIPVEIHVLPTGFEIEEYWDEYLSLTAQREADQDVVRVFVAAPHTADRDYLIGYQSLNLLTNLTGIEAQDLAIFLGDFNPFNIAAIEPQYIQYAMEILYVKAMFKQMVQWGQQEQEWIDNNGPYEHPQFADIGNARPDIDHITLVGTSLGGLSALHANAIDPTHSSLVLNYMPRPNAWHINNVWEYLDNWISPSAKNTLANVVGVKFPVASGDPLLGLLQTAIDSVDPANLVSHTRNQNTLLVLADYDNTLHGGDSSYSMASVFDRQMGMTGLWLMGWSESLHPYGHYLQTPLEPVDFPLTATPVRAVIPLLDAEWSILSFASQMQAGEGFLWKK